ncbi:unnamed protein product [Ixodes pacificus]
MQCSPYEIKDKLLKALDEDNNVSLTRFIASLESRSVSSAAGSPRKVAGVWGRNADVPCNQRPGQHGSWERALGLAPFPRCERTGGGPFSSTGERVVPRARPGRGGESVGDGPRVHARRAAAAGASACAVRLRRSSLRRHDPCALSTAVAGGGFYN